MAFQLSPGVNVSEIDLTTIVPSVATSIAAFAGEFQWGAVNEIITISDEVRLVDRFGYPNNDNFEYWFSAANFLAYSNNLKVVRAANTETTRNATSRIRGALTSYTVTAAGDSAIGLPAVTVTGTNTSPATATVNVKVTGVSISAPGTGYANNETLTATNGTGTSAVIKITNVDGNGNVLAVSITTAGKYSAVPTTTNNPFTSNTSVAGVGFRANLTYGLESVTVDAQGDGYDNYLGYTVTVSGNSIANAVVSATLTGNAAGLLVENEIDYGYNHSQTGNTYFGEFAAKYPGELGDSLRVEMADAATFGSWAYAGQFTDDPATSEFVGNLNGSNDELHIVIIDEDGKFTNAPGTVLEKFAFVSKASDAKTPDGSSNYYKNVINTRSRYIWWLAHPNNMTNWGTEAAATTYTSLGAVVARSLSNGTVGTVTEGDMRLAYDNFADPERVDVNLIIAGPASSFLASHLIENIAEVRKDCIVLISPERSDVVDQVGNEVDNIIAFRNQLTSSSYAVLDSGWKYQYDKYNDVYRWVPLNADIAGLCARTDRERDPWFSPAGLNRGIIKNVVKLSWNPNKTDRDDLYVKGINPIVTFPGEGHIMFGDKTLLTRPSAFDRINVRRLFIVLEKAIAKASRYSLFEFNDQFTRAQFVALVEPYLRDVQGRRGITDFRVVCDETNNTGEIIDRNEFVGDIYIKPARSINFIQLNFIAVRTGVAFEEVVGKF